MKLNLNIFHAVISLMIFFSLFLFSDLSFSFIDESQNFPPSYIDGLIHEAQFRRLLRDNSFNECFEFRIMRNNLSNADGNIFMTTLF